MSEWKETTLGKIVTFQRGHDLTQVDFEGGDYPIISSYGVLGYHDKYTTLKDGVTIGRSGNSIGKAFYVESNFWAHNTVLYVKEFHNSYPKFIFYLLKTINFKALDSGSAVPSLNRNYIHPLPVNVPRYDEQKRIADILSCLDAKIDNLRRQNETLEEIARSIFKHWFIDFEFPNADGKPYRSSGGAMVASELGDIPEGWRVGKLDEYIQMINGYSYKGSELTESSTALVNLKNFDRKGGFKIDSFKSLSTNNYKERHVVYPGDLVVAHTDLTQNAEVLGNPAIIQPSEKYNKYILSMDLVKIESNKSLINNSFWYHLLLTKSFKSHCVGYSNGTTVLHLSKRAIPDYTFSIPVKLDLIINFQRLACEVGSKITNNTKEIQTLTKTRDTLLPKLMSGQLRVKI
jgi:type I restriction enzyme, S subunit